MLLGKRLGVTPQSPIVPLIGALRHLLDHNRQSQATEREQEQPAGCCSERSSSTVQPIRDGVNLHSPLPLQSVFLMPAVGSEADTLAAASRLLQAGFYVPAIRPPTVPAGTSRSESS